ncbi:hypothetical protein Nepgr_018412 [Nepenthes gracilis]|uniref:Elongation factor Ts, mitochondrial n=1 Tax=Nepenthes gracilis TaxID=150966 RepID=A0AAD3STM1_NEPGR|nr:hypothetical protein Nepgr_018412 [Nepenthes gracilis]
MTPVIPCSANSSSFIPGTAFTRRSRFLLRFSVSGKSTKTLSSSRVVLPRLSSASIVPQFRSECAQHHISRIHRLLATGTDVAVDEQESPIADEDSPGPPKEPSPSLETNEDSSIKSGATATSTRSKRSRPARKSEMPPIQNEDLVPGAMFTGKVRSIQPFGAFVDFGAFTDGLVHVSRLSDSFVKDVGSVVSIGQEVKVRLVEVNIETGRISLSMRENGDSSKPQQRKEAVSGSEKARPGRSTSKSTPNKDQAKKSSKFVKGQDLVGTVKNKVRSGSFISLPGGEEGFLPASEESDEVMWNMTGGSSLEVGQEVNVCVLRVSRGQVTLTMKKEEDAEKLDTELNQGVVHVATNPFVLAFRKNSDIAAFLDERKKMDETAQISEKRETPGEVEGSTKQAETAHETPEVHGQSVAFYESVASVPAAADDVTDNKDISVLANNDNEAIEVEDASKEIPNSKESKDSSVSNKLHSLDGAVQISKEEVLEAEVVAMITNDKVQITSPVAEPSNDTKSYHSGDTVDQAFSLDRAFTEEIPAVNQAETDLATDEVEIPSSTAESDIPVAPSTEDGDKVDQISSSYSVVSEEIAETNQTETNLAKDDVEMPVVPSTEDGDKVDQISPSDSVVVEIAATNQAGSGFAKDDIKISSSTAEGDIPAALSAEGGAKVDQISSSGSLVSKEFVEETQIEEAKRNEVVQMQTAISGNDPQAEKQLVTPLPEKNGTFTSLNGEIDGVSSQGSIARDKLENDGKADPGDAAFSQILSSQSHDQADSNISKGELEIQLPAAESKISSAIPNGNDNAKAYEKDANVTNSSEPTDVPTSGESTPKGAATISPALVKQLREETGAGMMDCKRALSETGGDVIKAQEYLRKKGLASAEKKASRATSEGRIGSYIHDSKIGVLIEVNCETDFVSRGEIFKELVDDLAMQVAACPQVCYLVTEDVPKEITDKEREIEMQKEDLLSKPEQIRAKIVEGRIRKRLEELALFEQQYIKNDKVLVKDWIKQTIATIGENIKVKRFVRYNLGEGLEKKSQDFAAEVAAQTAAKPLSTPVKTQPAATETQKQEEKTSTVTVSASLVKKLREGTGAGMMDCKRALSETGGDLEKAQEYLRKKGLSTADKKSSRLAAEGRIGSYIHDSRIGVLIEVNCETDFVGRSEKFKELVDDLAMQVVACPQVQFVTIEGIPENIVSKEKEIEMQREDILSKPENIRGRIVEGRISKRLGELALLEQPFIKNDSILVKDLVKQTIASLGENIKVRRFVRFTLGEELEISKTEPES